MLFGVLVETTTPIKCPKKLSLGWPSKGFGFRVRNIGGLIIIIGFGENYTITIIRNPQHPILITKAPTVLRGSKE